MNQDTHSTQFQNRFGVAVAVLVVLVILIAGGLRGFLLRQRLAEYDARKAQLSSQIETEHRRTEEIDQYGKYVQTDEYVEEMAREKLGLVRDDEIIFKSVIPQE